MPPKLGRHRVVLLGIGHTNAYVLRKWKMRRLQNAELICVSNFPVATYSGMLPGVLARQYSVEEMQIDLVRLCESAGARLIVGDVTGWDREMRELQFANRPPLAYDWLSIGVGSRPTQADVSIESGANWVAIKPMQTMLARLEKSVSRVAASHANNEPPAETSERQVSMKR